MHLLHHLCNLSAPFSLLTLAIHIAVSIKAVAIVVAARAFTEKANDAIVALRVIQVKQVWRNVFREVRW